MEAKNRYKYLNHLQTKSVFFQVNKVSRREHRLRNLEFELFNARTRNLTVSIWVWVQIWKTASWGGCTWDVALLPNPHFVDLRSCWLGVSMDNCEITDESQVHENLVIPVTNRSPDLYSVSTPPMGLILNSATIYKMDKPSCLLRFRRNSSRCFLPSTLLCQSFFLSSD